MDCLQATGPQWRRGLGRVEVIAILVVIFALVVIGCLAAGWLGLLVPMGKAQRNALSMKDATQMKQIQAALPVFSQEFDGHYPLPSLLVLRATDGTEESAEDHTLNHSANIYSMLVMQNYVTPELLVSPLEVSSHVRAKASYDWESYSPADGVFWDDSFVMHIHDPAVGANASYSHLTAVGDRRKLHWRDTLDPTVPIVGNRAPMSGQGPDDRSPTLRFYPPEDQWVGNVCFNDNHIETLGNFYPQLTTFEPAGAEPPRKDNIFAADFEHPHGNQAAADAFLSIYIRATEFTVEDVYDPLE